MLVEHDTLLYENEGAPLAIRGQSSPDHHGGRLLPPEHCPVLQGEAVDVFGQKLVVLGVVDGLDGKKFFIHPNFQGSACQLAKFTPNLRRDFVL